MCVKELEAARVTLLVHIPACSTWQGCHFNTSTATMTAVGGVAVEHKLVS